jgi:hypothetical protein
MESNEYFKIEIETNYDHQEVFDISINLDLILAQTYHDKTPLFNISKDAYTPKPGDKLYFLPGVNIPRIKLKDLTLQYGIKTIRDIKDATVIFGSNNTIGKLSDSRHFYQIPVCIIQDFLELSKDKMDSRDVTKLETALAVNDKDYFLGSYNEKRVLSNADFPPFKTAIQNPVYKHTKELENMNYSFWYNVIDEEDSLILINKLKNSSVKIIDEESLLAIINGDDSIVITEEVFQNLFQMLASSDEDNHVLAMEIMANCNYKQSLLYLEILFKEFYNTLSRNHTKNHVNFKSLLSYLGKSPSSMSTSIDDIVHSLRQKGVLTSDKLNYIIDKYSDYLAQYGNTNIFKVKTITINEDILRELNLNYEKDILGEFEPVPVEEPVEEPIAEVIEQEEIVQQPEPESSSEDFIWN